MRYRLQASFSEEQRKGFVVKHTIDREFDDAEELSTVAMTFLSSYDSKYCHGMSYHVVEEEHK
jgi:hypothetical protein